MIFGLILTVILLPFVGGLLLQLLKFKERKYKQFYICLLYTSPSPRDV